MRGSVVLSQKSEERTHPSLMFPPWIIDSLIKMLDRNNQESGDSVIARSVATKQPIKKRNPSLMLPPTLKREPLKSLLPLPALLSQGLRFGVTMRQ